MCPVVVTKAEYDRLQAAINKGRNRGNTYKLSQSHPEPRFLFLKYMKNGTIRVKRLMVKKTGSGTYWTEKIGRHKMSRVLKVRKRHKIIIELDRPEDLEPLLQQVLEHLEADPSEGVSYYWEVDD